MKVRLSQEPLLEQVPEVSSPVENGVNEDLLPLDEVDDSVGLEVNLVEGAKADTVELRRDVAALGKLC